LNLSTVIVNDFFNLKWNILSLKYVYNSIGTNIDYRYISYGTESK
jgi:hypothetical protein